MKTAEQILSEQLEYDYMKIEDLSDRQVNSISKAMKIFASQAVDEMTLELKRMDDLLNNPEELGEYLAGI